MKPRHNVLVMLAVLVAASGLEARPGGFEKKRVKEREKRQQLEKSIAREIHNEIHSLAKKCFDAGAYGLSYRLVRRILDEDPDHKRARETLGYQRNTIDKKPVWLRPYGLQQLSKKRIWDRKLGWVPVKRKKDQAETVFCNAKWQPLKSLAQGQSRSKEPLEIETEHFSLRSSADYLRSVEVANALEDFHEEVFRVYVGFFVAGERQLTLFQGLKKKLVVRFFADEDEYEDFVEGYAEDEKDRKLLMDSAGFYSTKAHQSFFYDEEGEDHDATLFHEITHQILGETSDGGTKCPTWLAEGAAVYMESAHCFDTRVEFDLELNQRILKQSGRKPRPLAELLALDEDEFHGEKRSVNYGFAGIAVAFFSEYQDGLYREDFCQYLRNAYEAKPDGRSVFEYVGVAPKTLEREFKAYSKALGE